MEDRKIEDRRSKDQISNPEFRKEYTICSIPEGFPFSSTEREEVCQDQ